MANEKILIVDDNRELLSLCSTILKGNGYSTSQATRGEEALSQLCDGSIDMLLTDIYLPGLTGLEVTEKLRSRGIDIPVVAMTGYGNMDTAIKALTLGVDEFIVKPFTAEHLSYIVSRGLEKSRLRRENARLKTLLPLFENTKSFLGAASIQEIHQLVADAAAKLTGATQVGLLEYDQGSKFRLVSALGADLETHLGETAPLRFPNTARPSRLSQVISWRGEDRIQLPFGQKAPRGAGVLFAPMWSREKNLGYVMALRVGYFSQSELDAMAILAGQASAALENWRLIAEISRAYEELRTLDRLKSEFINIAAHELRTPLSVLMGYALLLQEELSGDQRERAKYIVDNAERLRRVAEELLSLRYLESGQAELRLEPIDVTRAIGAVVEAYRALAEQKEQHITAASQSEEIEIMADRAMFDLMLGNLISNAIKFSDRAAPIQVESYGDANQVTLAVRDRGHGIPPSERERIFERFYQVGNALTRQHEGLGLGLAITREMASAHGGKIWVESEPGKGSAFFISLPRVPVGGNNIARGGR